LFEFFGIFGLTMVVVKGREVMYGPVPVPTPSPDVEMAVDVPEVGTITSLPLTTTMVNSKIPNKSIKNPTLSSGLQDSSKGIGESLDPLNLLSRASSRAGKQVHSSGRPLTHRIAKCSPRSVSASSTSRNPSPEALSSSFSGESKEKSVGYDPKTPTVPRVITGKLWDGEHHALLLSGYSGHLETDTKMLSTSLKCLTGFIKQHLLGGRPIEQFPTILGVGS